LSFNIDILYSVSEEQFLLRKCYQRTCWNCMALPRWNYIHYQSR